MLELRSDLNRALSKAFVLSVLGTMLCVLFGAFSDVPIKPIELVPFWNSYGDEAILNIDKSVETEDSIIVVIQYLLLMQLTEQ